LAPRQPLPVCGAPCLLGLWVKGDGGSCFLAARYRDAQRQTRQVTYGDLDFTGWRYLTVPLDEPGSLSWGKGDPERIAYPISIDTLALVDGRRQAVKGRLQVAGAHLIYRERWATP